MKPAYLYIPNLRSKRLMTSIQQWTCGMDRNLGNCLRLDIKKFGIAYSFWNRMLDQFLLHTAHQPRCASGATPPLAHVCIFPGLVPRESQSPSKTIAQPNYWLGNPVAAS